MPARDFQRAKVYAAEIASTEVHGTKLTIRECQHFVTEVVEGSFFNQYSPTQEGIVVLDWKRASVKYGQAWKNGVIIEISERGREHMTLLHEVAHSMMIRINNRRIDRLADHGPEFVWVARSLFEIYLPEDWFTDWQHRARALGVQWQQGILQDFARAN